MIQGLISLFTSGLLLNPMVFAGIAGGFYIMSGYTKDEIMELFQNKNFYAVLFGIAFLFAFFFERVYHGDSKRINWKAVFGVAVGRFITLFISTVFTCICIFAVSFDTSESSKDESETSRQQQIEEQISQQMYQLQQQIQQQIGAPQSFDGQMPPQFNAPQFAAPQQPQKAPVQEQKQEQEIIFR